MPRSQPVKVQFSSAEGPMFIFTTTRDGGDSMTYIHLGYGTVQSSMVIRFTSLEDLEHSKQKFCKAKILDHIKFLRYTEIWSTDEESKYIQLAEPKLNQTDYFSYPELMLVDSKYCVKP